MARNPVASKAFAALVLISGALGTLPSLLVLFWGLSSQAPEVCIWAAMLCFGMALLWPMLVTLLVPRASRWLAPVGYAVVWTCLGLYSRDTSILAILWFVGLICLGLGRFGTWTIACLFPKRCGRGLPVSEPMCPHCGYGLYYASDHTCPDCGRPFLSAGIDMRLAKWEDGVLKPKE